MEIVGLIAMNIVNGIGSGYCYKIGSSRGVHPKSSPAFLCFLYMFLASAVYTIISFAVDGKYILSQQTFWIALMTGACFCTAAYFYLIAFTYGPFTPTVLVMNLSGFMPILYSYLFLKERITALQLAGFVLIVGVVLVLGSAKKTADSAQKKANKKWLVTMAGVFIVNGLIGFGVRMQAKLTPAGEVFEFFSVTFLVGFMLSLLFFLVAGGFRRRENIKSMVAPALGLTTFIGINVVIMQLLSGRLPAVVQYPVVSGISIIFSTLIGKFRFKDSLPPRAYAAMGVGVLAIVLLSL